MKRIFALALSFVFVLSLATFSASAVSNADNGILKIYGKADKSYPFYEGSCPDAYGFDVRGYVTLNGTERLIGSTYSNYGYHTYLNVDGAGGMMKGSIESYWDEEYKKLADRYYAGEIDYDEYDRLYDELREFYDSHYDNRATYWENMAYDCEGAATQNIGGLNLTVANSYVSGGKYVKISYTVNNPTGSAKKFSLATTADVQINGDDSAVIKMLPGGKGAKMISDNDNTMFTVDGSAGGVDSLWIGGWSGTYFLYMFDDSEDDAFYDGGDSAICWSYTDRTIKAGETLNYYVLMEVGINQSAEIRFTDTEDTLGNILHGVVSDPNIGTVDIHYTINGGTEQVIEGVFVNGGETAFEISLGDIECGSRLTVVAWAVDDAGEEGERETFDITVPHQWGPAEIITPPTYTTPGRVKYTCTDCGEFKYEDIIIGDLNLDGYVDNIDASLILKYDAAIIDLNPLQRCICDANGDGYVDNMDAALVLKFDAGLISNFPSAVFSIEEYVRLCNEYYQ